MKPVSKLNVRAFLAYMAREYDVTIVTKKSPLYQLIRSAVAAMGIDCAEKWLDKWCFTLPGMVWLSFVPGDGTTLQLQNQVMTICHEFIHVIQWRRDRAKFAARYVFRESDRAHYEAEAMHANLEMAYAFGLKPNLKLLSESLAAYRVRKEDIAITLQHLKIYDAVARSGAHAEEITKQACRWWNIENTAK